MRVARFTSTRCGGTKRVGGGTSRSGGVGTQGYVVRETGCRARSTRNGARDAGYGARGTGHGATEYRAARGTSRETGKCKHMVKKEEKHVERRKEKITTQRDKPGAIISCANARSKEFVKSTFVQDVEEHV